jgi:uncharacterized protein DUF3107
VDVRIGVIHTPREIDVEVEDDADRDELLGAIDKALSGDQAVLWLTDRNGRRYAIPGSKVAYVEIGGRDDRRVGFGAP